MFPLGVKASIKHMVDSIRLFYVMGQTSMTYRLPRPEAPQVRCWPFKKEYALTLFFSYMIFNVVLLRNNITRNRNRLKLYLVTIYFYYQCLDSH